MVTIRYFESATGKEFESHWVSNIGEFLKSKGFTRDELLDLRFFKTDVLGDEIDTVNGTFLTIHEGEIEIFHDSAVPRGPLVPYIPYIVFALAFAASIALTPKITPPNQGNRKQSSATNSLSQSTNEPALGKRIDDIFGTVTKHTPPLWQVPYRIGVNNQETEVLLVCVGRGKYDINTDNIYDGYTPYKTIPNAQASIYEPGTWPGNGTPSQTIRGVVTESIGIYRESNDLNPSELSPPNDTSLGEDALWSVSGTVLTLTNTTELGVDLHDYFTADSSVSLIDCFTSTVTGSTVLHRPIDIPGPPGQADLSKAFDHFSLYDISGEYLITNVTSDSLTLGGTSWAGTSGPLFQGGYYVRDDATGLPLFLGNDVELVAYTWYQTYTSPVSWTNPIATLSRGVNPDVGQVFDNIIGPLRIYDGASKVLLNLTSSSGFYKMDGPNEVSIDASVQFVIEELDVNGNPTGLGVSIPVTYSSNPNNIRSSVYQTVRIDIPYDRSRIYGRRTLDRDKRDNISNVDRIEWTSLYSFEDNPSIDFGDVTLMHCVIPSNSQSRLTKSRKTNLDLTRKITQYLGGGLFGPVESFPTDDFSQILIHTALDPKCGRLNINQINAENMLLLKQQIIDYFGSPEMTRFGYDFDTTEMSYEDMFTAICNVVNCIPYVQNGVYDAFFEREQPVSTMQITMRNKISESEVREDIFYKKYDGVELSFRNEETSISEVIYVPSDRTALNPERVEYTGCTSYLQALRRAWRIRNKQIYTVASVEFDVDEFGRVIVPGQRIDSPDATRFVRHKGNTEGYNVYDGEVVEVIGLNVELSEPVAFVAGEDHYIQFTNLTGENSELIQCTEGETEFDVVLVTVPTEAIYDGYDRDKTKYTFCSEQLRESIALIPQTIEFKIDSGKETNNITSINYDSRYYKDDLRTN